MWHTAASRIFPSSQQTIDMTHSPTRKRRRRPTLCLSAQGHRIIEDARQQQGWIMRDERWLRKAHESYNPEPTEGWEAYWEKNLGLNTKPSECTLKRFLKGNYVERSHFLAFCTAVGVDLDVVADLDCPIANLQHPSVIGDFPTEVANEPFYGRTTALTKLTTLVSNGNNRLIQVNGRAGMGKTTLGCRVIRQVGSQFDFLIWLSLESSPLLSELFPQVLSCLPEQSAQPSDLLSFLKVLKEHRCLVIFDQWETIMLAEQPERYRPDYEDYGDFLRQISRNHQSCVVVMSRVRLDNTNLLKANEADRIVKLEELRYLEDREFLKELSGTEEQLNSFMTIYNNPSILKLAIASVMEVLGGDVSPLIGGSSIFGTTNVETLMADEFKVLSASEEKLIYWLAIWQDSVPFDYIQKTMQMGNCFNTLECLTRKRSLVNVRLDEDAGGNEFGLDRLTLKYVTQEFVKRNVKELLDAIKNQVIKPNHLIVSHAFLTGTDPELKQQQQRRIVQPIVEKLQAESVQGEELKQALEALKLTKLGDYALDNLNYLLEVASN
jgi:NB-ARC domain